MMNEAHTTTIDDYGYMSEVNITIGQQNIWIHSTDIGVMHDCTIVNLLPLEDLETYKKCS